MYGINPKDLEAVRRLHGKLDMAFAVMVSVSHLVGRVGLLTAVCRALEVPDSVEDGREDLKPFLGDIQEALQNYFEAARRVAVELEGADHGGQAH